MHRNHYRWLPLLAVPCALLALSGCGGGAGGTDTAAAGRAATLNVYVTDGFTDAYKQVLVTLYKIEVSTDGITYETVFSETEGQTLDLSSLADTAQLVASLNIATGAYTKARITIGDYFTLVNRDGSSTSAPVSSDVATVANGQATLTVDTPAKVLAGQKNTLLLDFKLAAFELVGGKVRPHLEGGDETQCAGKQRSGALRGTITNLDGTTSFDLVSPGGGDTLKVFLVDSTVISGGDTADTTLANGQNVRVEGTVDAAAGTLTATAITVIDSTAHARAVGANGIVASVNADAKSFVLTVKHAQGIQPTSGTITIQTDADTAFLAGRKKQGLFSDIVAGGVVHVDGTFDAATQTLTAKAVGFRKD